jgi:hypothetical protein
MKYTKEHQEKGAELMKSLVEKAWESASFKDQLIKNPLATIQEFTNKSFVLPDNQSIVVEDQTNESVIYFNIPAEPNLDGLELTEEQLELVAGGLTPAVVIGLYALGVAAFAAGVQLYNQ